MPPTTALSWQAAFIATTVAIGGTLEDAHGALGADDWTTGRGGLAGLSHEDRLVRARTLASKIAQIVGDLEALRLA